jgi:valyl-tRNA synthetase
MSSMMDKTFDPAAVEARTAALWDETQPFRAGRPERLAAKPFTIVIPPPNVTGSLHMGHALNNTLQDILCRFERMRGRDVLWQPGTDHAGIATQMVVERQLAQRQEPGRREMGRDAFLQRVWAWKDESGGTITRQLKRLGASCDWSRERFTMDEGLSRAVTKVFVELHRQGLIYRDKRLVNWDPVLLTAISDLEVQPLEIGGHLWHIRYPIEGSDETITVATTRPETMLGDTGIAVHPDDERYRHLVGRFALLPLVGRRIEIVADAYSDPEKGTGAVKITPAHDFNDFDVGRRHGLELINIFTADAKLDLADNAAFRYGLPGSADLDAILALHGLDRVKARESILAMLAERGALEKVEPHGHMVPHGDRSGAVIEPWLTDQWYVDAKTLAQPALAAVREGRTAFVPKNWEKTYFEWLDNIQPWCISRQLWWGHQIPVWYGPSPGERPRSIVLNEKKVFVEESQEAVLTSAGEYYENFFPNREIKILANQDEYNAAVSELINKSDAPVPMYRDPDVLDTWFSSALWPFSTLGWPDETEELKRHYPTDVLVTGFDIIFFWVARMMMMGLRFMPDVPFRTVYIHALVRDESGAKMSKSKGNVIDPLDLIDRYGADALRFTLAAMAAQGRDIKLATGRVEGYRNFATKLWNAARFAEMNGCKRVEGFDPASVSETLNRWALAELSRTVSEVTTAIEAYRFNEAAAAAYRFVWNIYCDWYLELAKPVLSGPHGAAKAETQAAIAHVLDEILKLLHPFMPFITEELWAIKGADGPARQSVLALAAWPIGLSEIDTEAEQEIGWLVDLVAEIRSARAETNVPAGALIPLVLVQPAPLTRARAERWMDRLTRLARLSDVSFALAPPAQSLQLVVRGEGAALPLAGIIDIAAERARLAKEISRLDADVTKIDAKLANADFIARAPEEVVEEQHERRDEAGQRIAKLREALARLAAAE